MITHFDFFTFYDTTIIAACDENDEIMGYGCLKAPNEMCQLYVKVEYRGTGLVHILVWKIVELARERGQKTIWGIFYPHLKGLYIKYMQKFDRPIVEEEAPEERADGQWRLVFDISSLDPDRRPKI
jgi:hypothetical protein